MDDEKLKELERLVGAATPSPWVVAAEKHTAVGDVRMEHGGFPERGYSHWCSLRPEDARFIAASREAVPALIAEVRSLRARVDEVERGRDKAVDDVLASRAKVCDDLLEMQEERDAALSRCAALEAERDEAVTAARDEYESRVRVYADLVALREHHAILEQQALADATQLQAMDAERAELHAKLGEAQARACGHSDYMTRCFEAAEIAGLDVDLVDGIKALKAERNAARRHATECAEALEKVSAQASVMRTVLQRFRNFSCGCVYDANDMLIGGLCNLCRALASDAGSALLGELRLLREVAEAMPALLRCLKHRGCYCNGEYECDGCASTGRAGAALAALDAKVKP